ncbi:aquaporin [Wallemia mellicola]|nr:aquaporin [Wallemia mellicola]
MQSQDNHGAGQSHNEQQHSGRVEAMRPDAKAIHDERMRRVKSKPVFGVGGPMPDRTDEKQEDKHPSVDENNDDSVRSPIGQTGGQVGGVITDATDEDKAQDIDNSKPDLTHQNTESTFKRMGDRELNENDGSTANENASPSGQIGGNLHSQWLDMDETQEKFDNPNEPIYNFWFKWRENFREPLAEFLGACVLIIIGVGSTVQTLVYTKDPTAAYSNLNWAWGVAVMTSVYISGGISGGHLNPALTTSLALFRGFPWKLVGLYWIAQILGCFAGGLIVYAMYYQALDVFDPNKSVSQSGTAGLFVTMPATSLSHVGLCVFQEIIASAVLSIAILALGDRDNTPPGAGLGALVIAFVIMAIGTSLGALSGYAMNPARDLGPRIALSCVGYNARALWTHDRAWWVTGPVCGSLMGSFLGSMVYDTLIYSGLGSPVNFTSKQWERLLTPHNMVKAGLEKRKREKAERQRNEESSRKGDKAV